MVDSLFRKHLLQRALNAALDTQEWQCLRIQQREDIDRVGLMMMNQTDWLRQAAEITELSLQQNQRLSALLDQQRKD
ncbi:MAG: hypothetical protein EOO39_23160 [Cytophagaceae bacterium]|nr:MAG: hypothetical protein EOO39_23160 [Cytophagaceae bacterium]